MPDIKKVLSLGPSTSINEHQLASRHPHTSFTLIDANREALQKAKDGRWVIDGQEITREKVNIVLATQNGSHYFQDEGTALTCTGKGTIDYIHDTFPIEGYEKKFDLCLAFNSLPDAASKKIHGPIYHWVIDRIRPDGLLATHFGVFQKREDGMKRFLRTNEQRDPDDHVEKFFALMTAENSTQESLR